MIRIPAALGISLAQVLAASDSVKAETVTAEPYATRISAALDLLNRSAALIGRSGRVTITSMLRSPQRNAEQPDAAQYSHHLTGYAVDFIVRGVPHGIVFDALRDQKTLLGFDELAVYDDHIHLSADPRRRGKVLDFRTTMKPAPEPANRAGVATFPPLLALALVALVLYAWSNR